MTKILVINGSYRNDGITDQVVKTMAESLQTAGAEVEIILLREYPIKFCLNCRECTQQPGTAPGKCIQNDNMQELIEKIEKADGYIFASPTNFGTVTALFKRFMERLVVYGYWPWGTHTPENRKSKPFKKKAVLVTSCAASGIMGRLFFDTIKQLKSVAKTIGAQTVDTMFIGMIAQEEHPKLPDDIKKKAEKLAKKLVSD